jgi:NADPH:quinone reductase-like Zn-dependent oxidoreductase
MVDLPSLQRTLLLESQGGVLVLGHTTIPKPGRGQVLVKIKATALNPADWKVSKYGYFITEYPSILGVDLSGDIVAIGEGVTKFKVGDRV